MWFPLLLVFLDIFLVQGERDRNALPHTKCDRTWEKVGCFKENINKGKRTLPVLLVSDRDPTSKAYDGHRLDWHAWEESMLSLACRCANATREKGWKVFGLQFYGECWSGENGETLFNKYGNAQPSNCVQGLVDPIPSCDINKEMECVGAQRTNYIYRLKDLDINECAVSSPCKNGGTCSNIPGSYKCTCDVKYTGKNCETDVNECILYKPCNNGGTCVNIVGGYNCQCPDNYKGKNCDEDVNECSTNPCKNGANCTNIHGDYKCACDNRFTGKNCDQDVNECILYKPCKNGGTCVNTVGGYNCQCPDNYKGKNCDEDVDECKVRNPCKNGAKCINSIGGYSCQCPPDFKGKHCDEAPAECSSYSKLSEADRASGRHRGNVLKCDRDDLADGWYRFTDDAGTRMPTSPVATHYCGTHAPGWMNGQHPTTDDGAVKRQVCFNWNNNVCLWSIEISVRNCGGFYVYWLPKTPVCWLRYCGQNGDVPAECSSYSKLSEADRASGRHRGNVLKCDRYDIADGWYRFTDDAGTRMPTSSVATHHCGTHAPGWMNGQHPTKDDGAVKRQVCFNWNNNVCLWSVEISVRNCGGFYVYWLPWTPYCWLRYCGNHDGHAPAECSSYSKLSQADRASGRHRGNVLKCDRYDLADGWYRFTDDAGTRMPTSSVAIHHCGTHAPGWMNGQHPTKDDGAVKRQVCFHWNNNACLWSVEISVRNCGGFYVYWLPRTPYCWLRYCGHNGHGNVWG